MQGPCLQLANTVTDFLLRAASQGADHGRGLWPGVWQQPADRQSLTPVCALLLLCSADCRELTKADAFDLVDGNSLQTAMMSQKFDQARLQVRGSRACLVVA